MTRFAASRGFVTVVGLGVVTLLLFAGYLLAFDPVKKTVGYCALMPDAIGLYPGNHVTTLGIVVGSVTAVEPGDGAVRVDFDVDAEHALRGEVTATSVSDTLIADRDLAVLGRPDAPAWNPEVCVTETFTPKSITQTLDAVSTLADDLAGGPGDPQRIRDSVRAFDAATAGSGDRLNALIKDLGAALHRPDAAIGRIGALLDALASLSESVAINWADIKTMVIQAAPGIAFINQVWGQVVRIIDSLLVIFPWFNDIAHSYGRPILDGLDELVPYLKSLAANVGTIQQLIDMVPAISSAFERAVDPDTGAVRVSYASPRVALAPESAEPVCALVQATMPGRCRSTDGLTTVDLVPLILSLGGAR